MKIITISNQKGGVGKTTTAHALGIGLQLKKKRVLFIDIDPQGNLSHTMQISEPTSGIYELLKGKEEIKNTITKTILGDIIPSSLLLSGADMEFTQIGRESILKKAIQNIASEYDYVIIDTPPTIGILTINALTASDEVIIPLSADMYSLQGLSQLKGTIDSVRMYSNSKLVIAGLLMTRYNPRTIINKDIKKTIEDIAINILQTRVFKNTIREGIAVREAQVAQESIYKYAPKSNLAKDYKAFVKEYLEME